MTIDKLRRRTTADAVAWAWHEIRARRYPAATGLVLVYLAAKASRDDAGRWVAAASHGELAEISGSQMRTVRTVLERLYGDGLVRNAPRGLSPSRTQRAMFLAVGREERDG